MLLGELICSWDSGYALGTAYILLGQLICSWDSGLAIKWGFDPMLGIKLGSDHSLIKLASDPPHFINLVRRGISQGPSPRL